MKNFKLFILLIAFNSFSQEKIENLKINWPEEYQWKIGSNQETQQIHFMEIIPGNESVDSWTIIGTMMSIKGATGIPMDKAISLMYEQTKASAPKAQLTVIEKSETGKNHWALFKIESPSFKGDKTPESQLYYIIQGESSLYSNFVAVKEKKLSSEFIEKWSKVFKSSELVFE